MRRPPETIARDQTRLAGVHPALVDAVTSALDAMDALGFPMFVTEGVRSDSRQQALYAQGRTAPGPIVTKVDGVTRKSMHQVQADGFGHAVDCAFVDDPETTLVETYSPRQPWDLYGAMAELWGFSWGGRWVGLVDRPHVEMQAGWKGGL